MTNDNCYDPSILRTAVFPRQEYQRRTKDEKPFRALVVPNFCCIKSNSLRKIKVETKLVQILSI